MSNELNTCEELYYYTLAHGDPSFIHQHAVDAISAQNHNASDKPIKLTFALVGLYLHVEKQFTGKQVQLAHIKLGQNRQVWPTFSVPQARGTITVNDVLSAPAGPDRDRIIHQWCSSVWEAFCDNRQLIEKLLTENGII